MTATRRRFSFSYNLVMAYVLAIGAVLWSAANLVTAAKGETIEAQAVVWWLASIVGAWYFSEKL